MSNHQKKLIIEKLIEKYKNSLGLSEWTITVKISDKYCPKDRNCEAVIEECIKYIAADLTIYKRFWENLVSQETIILHELTHLILCPLHPYLPPIADDILEGIVQKLAVNFKKNDNLRSK